MDWLRAGLSAAVLLGLVTSARAGTELVTNGGFEQTTLAGSHQFTTEVTGWTTNGYNFLFFPGTATTAGAQGQYGGLSLWGSNGFKDPSPAGGNFIGNDGAFEVDPVSQVIKGLTPGKTYDVSFYWAGAQQAGFNGATTEQWSVSLGRETHGTAIIDNPNHGFTGWLHDTIAFTATDASETLSFLAHGTPDGVPPFALLDGVSMQAVPEPSSLILGGGLAAFGGVRLLRSRLTRKPEARA